MLIEPLYADDLLARVYAEAEMSLDVQSEGDTVTLSIAGHSSAIGVADAAPSVAIWNVTPRTHRCFSA